MRPARNPEKTSQDCAETFLKLHSQFMADSRDTAQPGKTSLALLPALSLLLILGLGLRAAFFLTSAAILPPSSDESISMLLAQRIADGDRPLLFMAQPYLFPLESYLLAPLAKVLPPTALGARLPIALLHLMALALQLHLLRRLIASRGLLLAGASLLLAPSSYVLMLQSAYSMPGYAAVALMGFGMLALAGRLSERAHPAGFAALGFMGGLAYAGHQLSVLFFIPAALWALSATPRRSWRGALPSLGAGLFLGLLPHVIARVRMPGAHAAAEGARGAGELVRRLWNPGLTHALQGALGWRIPPFPDETALPSAWAAWQNAAAAAVLALLALFAAHFVWSRRRSTGLTRRRLHGADACWLIFALNLVVYAASERATSASYRYLLPAALVFPYLIVNLATRWPRLRAPVLALACLLFAVNLRAAHRLWTTWRAPDFAERVAKLPDTAPALAALRDAGIRHAIASYGAAYRLTFESGGEVLCAQPQNERFPHWPHPFVDEVWRAPRIAYVLTERIRFLKPSVFERHLRVMGVRATVATAGAFRVYHDFQPDPEEGAARRLDPDGWRLRSGPAERDAQVAADGDPRTHWTTTHPMRGGEWIEVRWPALHALNRLILDHGPHHHDAPESYRLQLHTPDGWRIVEEKVPHALDKFHLDRGHPRYGRATRTFRLRGAPADGIRIEIETPLTNRHWSVAEIEVYVRDAPDTARPGAGGSP